MSAIITKQQSKLTLFTLSVLAGFLIGMIALLELPIKWRIAIIVVMASSLIMLIIRDVEHILLFGLVFIIPFHIGIGLPPIITRFDHIGQWLSFDVQLIDILVLLLLMCRLARLADHQAEIHFYSLITIPALVWLLAGALSALSAREMDLVWIQMGETAKLFLLYIVVANSIRTTADIKWLVWALLLGVLFQGVLGSYQGIIGRPLGLSFLGEPSQLYFGRSLGTVGHPNSYAAYMATTLPIAFAVLFLNVRWFYKALVGFILCFGALGLLFSLSRSGWLSFVIASTAIFVFAIYRRRQNFHINFGVAASLIFLLFLLALSQRELIVDRLTSSQATASAYSRVTMAQGAIAMIQDYPILGVGANNYSLYMPKYDPFDFKRENQIVIVHNVYLLTAAETGLVGLAVFLWFLVSLFIQSIRVTSRATDDIVWLAGVGVFSAFVALSVHGIVEYDMLANVIVFRSFWLFAAIVAVLSENLKRERSDLSQVESGGLHA